MCSVNKKQRRKMEDNCLLALSEGRFKGKAKEIIGEYERRCRTKRIDKKLDVGGNKDVTE